MRSSIGKGHQHESPAKMGTRPDRCRRLRARRGAGCAGIAPTSGKIAVGGSNPRQHWRGTHPQGCVVCAQNHRALAHAVGGPCPALAPAPLRGAGDPWARPDYRQSREAKAGARLSSQGRSRSPAQEQEQAAATWAAGSGSRASQQHGPAVRLDCGARFAAARRPSVILIAGYDLRPQGVAVLARRASGRQAVCSRPQAVGSPDQGVPSAVRPCPAPGRAAASAGCGRCGKSALKGMQKCFLHYMQKTFFPHAEGRIPARVSRAALETLIIAGAQADNAGPLRCQARVIIAGPALPRKQDQGQH